MAKVRQNIIIHGLSGSLGDQLVIRQDRGRTIVSVKPALDPGRESSAAQQAHRAEFKEAAAYASDAAKETPAYAEKAAGTPRSAYNVAMADWFHPPEIADVDLSGWTGQAGEAIRIKAVDDVQVKQVTVVITDEADAVLEQGAAVRAEGLWWAYTTTAAAAGNPKVLVTAQDLPGHIAQARRGRSNPARDGHGREVDPAAGVQRMASGDARKRMGHLHPLSRSGFPSAESRSGIEDWPGRWEAASGCSARGARITSQPRGLFLGAPVADAGVCPRYLGSRGVAME